MKPTNLYRFICVCVLLITICSGCGSPKDLTKREAGEPFSDWEKTYYGSAKFLDGDTVLVSIFFDDRDAMWTSIDREHIKTNMDAANEFLVKQGARYGKDVNLIYDLDKHPDLEYHLAYHSSYPGSFDYNGDETEEDKKVLDMLDEVYRYVHEEIPTEQIMKKYQVNSIGYLVFVDHESDRALTYSYNIDSHPYNYTEICLLNLNWEISQRDVCASTFAHEILHLFGAKDLYCTSEYYGMDANAVRYAYNNYKKDIMLGSLRKGVDWKKRVSGEISDVTAYYLGWVASSKFTNKFPYLQVKEQACFRENNDKGRNYIAPLLSGRMWEEKDYISNLILNNIVILLIIISAIYTYVKEKIVHKKKKQVVYVMNPMLDYEEFERLYIQENNIENKE